MCFLAILISSFEKILFSSVAHFLIGSLILGEFRFHLTSVRIAITKNTTKNMCWQGCGEKGTLSTAGGNASWCNHSGKKFGGFLKI
jgi:hypothetical protein